MKYILTYILFHIFLFISAKSDSRMKINFQNLLLNKEKNNMHNNYYI